MNPDLAWQASGTCGQTDPDAWFPDDGGHPGVALRMCASCPVLGTCREDTLTMDAARWVEDIFGVRGGLSQGRRRAIMRKANRERDSATMEGMTA
jgi:WhiB family transcriptional regulator, redox-sensing transcriptional regulator